MGAQTFATARKTSTMEDATQALERVRRFYSRVGYCEIVEKRLLDLLTQEISPGSKVAEDFRNTLWDNTFIGGTVSASVTREVFESLGRGDETDPNWN